MQRDHARLLERKLEGDRRIATLQQKLQQARKQQGGGGGAVDGGGGGQQQQAGSVPLTVEHERGARLAAEAKVCLCGRVSFSALGHLHTTLSKSCLFCQTC